MTFQPPEPMFPPSMAPPGTVLPGANISPLGSIGPPGAMGPPPVPSNLGGPGGAGLAPPPGSPLPPGGGPVPPGLPPGPMGMGMGMPPGMGPGAGPVIDPIGDFYALLMQVADEQGDEVAAQAVMLIPEDKLELIRSGLSRDPQKLYRFDELLDLEHKIDYPKWFTPPPKPTVDDCRAAVNKDETNWSKVKERIAQDLRFYHQQISATFDDFDHQANGDRAYLSPAMSDEARAVIAMIGTIDPLYDVPWIDLAKQDDAQLVEDALYYWDRESMQEYTNAGNGEYKMDVATYLLTTGYVMSQQYISIDGDRPLFRERLLSPETTFPAWDDHGLRRVTRSYTDTVANVIADFDVNGSTKVKNKLLKKTKTVPDPERPRKTMEQNYTLDDWVGVKVYCDRWWYCVLVEDEQIVGPVAHKYGFVPYCVRGSGLGDPPHITAPQEQDVELPPNGERWPAPPSSGGGITDHDARLELLNVSWFHFRKEVNKLKEEIVSDMLVALKHLNKPAFAHEQDELAEVQGDDLEEYGPGAKIKLKLGHERLTMLMNSPGAASIIGPVLQSIMQDEASNAVPKSFFGVFESANQSGNAMEGAYESGRDKIVPWLTAMSAYYADRATMRLKMVRDWGYLIESEYSPTGYGSFLVGRNADNRTSGPSAGIVSKQTIKASGTVVFANMRHLRMQNLGPLGNAVSIWMHQNSMSAREAIEMRGHRDPDAVFRQIRQEKAMMDEGLQKAITYQELARSDPTAAALYLNITMGGKGPEPSGMGPPGPGAGGFGGPAPPPGPNTSAMNLPALGLGPMGPTGRPPGGGPPPPIGL